MRINYYYIRIWFTVLTAPPMNTLARQNEFRMLNGCAESVAMITIAFRAPSMLHCWQWKKRRRKSVLLCFLCLATVSVINNQQLNYYYIILLNFSLYYTLRIIYFFIILFFNTPLLLLHILTHTQHLSSSWRAVPSAKCLGLSFRYIQLSILCERRRRWQAAPICAIFAAELAPSQHWSLLSPFP